MIEFKRSHFEWNVTLWAVRRYVAYPINWRMDETYVRVKGSWKYLYRAVDKAGAMADFLLTAKRDRKAALRFLRKVIGRNATPEKITIDKSGVNTAALETQMPNMRQALRSVRSNTPTTSSNRTIGPSSGGAANAGGQIVPVSRRDARRCRTHSHDSERPVGDDRRNVSGAKILFVGRIGPDVFLALAYPPGKFATERRNISACMGRSEYRPQSQRADTWPSE
jgi:hypothetical protein